MEHKHRSKIRKRIPIQTKTIPTRRNNKQPTRKLQTKQTTKRQDKIPNTRPGLPTRKNHRRTIHSHDHNLRQTRNQQQRKTTTLLQPTRQIRPDNEHLRKLPSQTKQTPYKQDTITNSLLGHYVIYVRKNYF